MDLISVEIQVFYRGLIITNQKLTFWTKHFLNYFKFEQSSKAGL